MKERKFFSAIWIPAPIGTAFSFFSKAENLDKLTPPWLHFEILTPSPIEMRAGTLLDYRLKLHGIPIKWRTQIVQWSPPFQFVDLQLRGPYRKWVHTHLFSEKEEGTLVEDQVVYSITGFFLEPLINRYLVEPDLQRIFKYRRTQLTELLKSNTF